MIPSNPEKRQAAIGLRCDAEELYTGVPLGNAVAKQLYRSVGFVETGLVEDGMEEMKYTC